MTVDSRRVQRNSDRCSGQKRKTKKLGNFVELVNVTKCNPLCHFRDKRTDLPLTMLSIITFIRRDFSMGITLLVVEMPLCLNVIDFLFSLETRLECLDLYTFI